LVSSSDVVEEQKQGIYSKVKENVKLSLCLTTYHAMKIYPLLNLVAPHDDLQESGSIAPHIPNLGIRWNSVVSFTTLWPLYPRRKSLQVRTG